jgi:hypothetical protein
VCQWPQCFDGTVLFAKLVKFKRRDLIVIHGFAMFIQACLLDGFHFFDEFLHAFRVVA